jgi:hypothetical protein
MAEYANREHFIPLRRTDLVDMLERDLPEGDREPFRQFCKLVTAIYHFEYNDLLDKLKVAYAPFDPDSDCVSPYKVRSEERQQHLNSLFGEFGYLMERANFKHLSRDELAPALESASDWGLRTDVDFSMFERLAMFCRGDGTDRRTRRVPGKWWRTEEVTVPVYKRLAMILKLRPSKRLDSRVNTERVYLQIFKNIPKLDVGMLLPGARVRMTRFDQGKVGLPLLSGVGMAVYNIADNVIEALMRSAANPSMFVWGLASGAVGYGCKSYYSYAGTKQRYHLNLTQVLYFQNLDTNSGVLFRLIDEAEEQECREAILAYYVLWRHAGDKGFTSEALDDYVEIDLERRCELKVDFEIGDAIAKLEKLQIVAKAGERYRARPMRDALRELDNTWDNYFKYNNEAVSV